MNANYTGRDPLKLTGFDITQYKSMFDKPVRIEAPLSWVTHIPFAFFLVEILRPAVFAELGTHTGNSYNAFCQAVKRIGLDTACYAVDTWQGDDQAGFYDETVYRDLAAFQERTYPAFSRLFRMTFDEAAALFSDGSIDLLHIDGYHTYRAVRHDFDTWLPKMSRRGVIILHDTMVRGEGFGVWRLWEEVAGRYESHNFSHGHGLGVLAVGEQVDDRFLEFLAASKKNDMYDAFFESLGSAVELAYQNSRLKNEIESRDETLNDIYQSFSYKLICRGRENRHVMRLYEKMVRPVVLALERFRSPCI